MTSNASQQACPESFYQLVKQVLENFYDFPYLNRHPLAKHVQVARVRPSEMDGQRLRRVFASVIDSLKPSGEAEERSIHGRYYRLLQLRYVDSNTMQEVARLLGVSERQAYRDLKRAEESLAQMLWVQLGSSLEGQIPDQAPAEPAAPDLTDAEDTTGDLQELTLQMTGVQVDLLLQNALKAVDRLAIERSIEIKLLPIPAPAQIYTDTSIAQQMLISILSSIIQQEDAGRIRIQAETSRDHMRLVFYFTQRSDLPYQLPGGQAIEMLLQRLSWQVSLEAGGDGMALVLSIPMRESVLLVIDDNNALIELLRRYLTHTRCQVVGATDGMQGLQLAQTLHPSAILLDVMMPNIDGWEILQRLRANPETSHNTVIICSIFNDPMLARSLGAAYTLGKPVKRSELLDLLGRLHLL